MIKHLGSWLLGLACASVAGVGVCEAQSELYNSRVEFQIGATTANHEAYRFASHYVEYVAHAERAYFDLSKPVQTTAPLRTLSKDERNNPLLRKSLDRLDRFMQRRWAFVRGYNGCPKDDPGCNGWRPQLPGLAVHIWRRRANPCDEVVVAYRGTDATELGDLATNFRGFVPRVIGWTYDDQYEQVRRSIPVIVDRITRIPCYREGRTAITAVGHSLGGGLAQHAAYAHGSIKRVYAIDSSPVTGYSDFARSTVTQNSHDLHIDSVYEKGEFLQKPREMQEWFAGVRVCHPKVRTVAFDTIQPLDRFEQQHFTRAEQERLNWFSQHSSTRLALRLFELRRFARNHRGLVEPDLPDAEAGLMAHCAPSTVVTSADGTVRLAAVPGRRRIASDGRIRQAAADTAAAPAGQFFAMANPAGPLASNEPSRVSRPDRHEVH